VDLDREEEHEQIGECDLDNRKLKVGLGMTDFDTLETWVHEAYHAAHPEASEEQTERAANWIARVLWAAGFRHPHLKDITEE
jgi:hypothetical protein